MLKFKAIIKKFEKQGEKTGWTFIEIPEKLANQLQPGRKTSFMVKGRLDDFEFRQMSLLPMGGGDFIMPLKADVRKVIAKRVGYVLEVEMESDESPFLFSEDFMACLNDDPLAFEFFKSLPFSHRKYFSKWIDSAKTTETKTKRILQAVKALSRKKGYADMIRDGKKDK